MFSSSNLRQAGTLNPTHRTLNPTLRTLNPILRTLNPTYTLNPALHTLNPSVPYPNVAYPGQQTQQRGNLRTERAIDRNNRPTVSCFPVFAGHTLIAKNKTSAFLQSRGVYLHVREPAVGIVTTVRCFEHYSLTSFFAVERSVFTHEGTCGGHSHGCSLLCTLFPHTHAAA